MAQANNLEVRLEDCNGDFERMLKRFLKKFKKNGLMEELKDHEYYIKPSDIKRAEKKRRKQVLRKLREKQENQTNYRR